MMPDSEKTAFIAGAGPRLGGALATLLAGNGYRVVILARSEDALATAGVEDLPTVSAHQCDLTNAKMTAQILDSLIGEGGTPDVGIYNAGMIHIGEFAGTGPDVFSRLWEVNCAGAVHFAHGLLPAMEAAGKGTMIFSGATASVKGGVRFSAFASSKFALRGLAQSLAREYGPKGIHVAHAVIDGVIWGEKARDEFKMNEVDCMAADDIARSYLSLIQQPRSAWSQEIDLRPFGENF